MTTKRGSNKREAIQACESTPPIASQSVHWPRAVDAPQASAVENSNAAVVALVIDRRLARLPASLAEVIDGGQARPTINPAIARQDRGEHVAAFPDGNRRFVGWVHLTEDDGVC